MFRWCLDNVFVPWFPTTVNMRTMTCHVLDRPEPPLPPSTRLGARTSISQLHWHPEVEYQKWPDFIMMDDTASAYTLFIQYFWLQIRNTVKFNETCINVVNGKFAVMKVVIKVNLVLMRQDFMFDCSVLKENVWLWMMCMLWVSCVSC